MYTQLARESRFFGENEAKAHEGWGGGHALAGGGEGGREGGHIVGSRALVASIMPLRHRSGLHMCPRTAIYVSDARYAARGPAAARTQHVYQYEQLSTHVASTSTLDMHPQPRVLCLLSSV
jgi:hypothetical protein